jgi:hypothetical protein
VVGNYIPNHVLTTLALTALLGKATVTVARFSHTMYFIVFEISKFAKRIEPFFGWHESSVLKLIYRNPG